MTRLRPLDGRRSLAILALGTGVALCLRRIADGGTDLRAYLAAAQRLISTGTPYHPALALGPIANVPENVPIGYLYAPPLAQAFTLLVWLPSTAIVLGWAIPQVVALAISLPRLFERFGGSASLDARLAIWLLIALDWTLQDALAVGNVSGWIAIGVTFMLLIPPRVGGAAGAILAMIKTTALPLVLPALADSRSRRAALVTLAAIGLVFIPLAPAAWIGWIEVLPNIIRFPMAEAQRNFAPVAVLDAYALGTVGWVLGLLIAVAGCLASVALARQGRWAAGVAAATIGMVFSGATVWAHYIASLVPLVVAAWPTATARERLPLGLLIAVHVVQWFGAEPADPFRLLYLVAQVVGGAVAVAVLARHSPEPVRYGVETMANGMRRRTADGPAGSRTAGTSRVA